MAKGIEKVVGGCLIMGLLAFGVAGFAAETENVEWKGRIGEIGGMARCAYGIAFDKTMKYAYLPGKGLTTPTVWVINVAVPASPEIAGTFDIPNPEELTPEAWDAQVVGDLLYIASFKCGLWIYDITNPVEPVIKGFLRDENSESRGLNVVGNYAYLYEAYHGFRIVDISDPTAPVQKSLYQIDELKPITNAADGASIDTPAEFHSGIIVDNKAYCGAGDHGLVIIDVTDAENPDGLAMYSRNGNVFTGAEADQWPPGNWGRGCNVWGDYALLGDNRGGVRIIDISGDLTESEEVGHYWIPPEEEGMESPQEVWKVIVPH